MKAIIIDYEEHDHLILTNLLAEKHKDIQIVGRAYNLSEGYNMLRQLQPNLVFLDVEMPDGLVFELLRKFASPNFYLIFTTRHSRYAHTAIRLGALDYLLKPILEEELLEAINRAKNKQIGKMAELQIQTLTESFLSIQQKQLPTRLAISTSESIIYKEVKNIVRLEAKQNYTEFTFADAPKKILASINLGEYEEQFKAYSQFMRVHRSHLVNLRYVEQYVKGDGGYLHIRGGEKIIVSKRYKERLMSKLKMI